MLSLTLLLGLIFIQFCLALWSSHVRKRELVYMLLVKWYVYLSCVIFCLFLFLLVSEVGCGLWLWHSLDFSLNISARHINMKTKQNNNNKKTKKKKKKKKKTTTKKTKQTNKKTYDWVSRATDRFQFFVFPLTHFKTKTLFGGESWSISWLSFWLDYVLFLPVVDVSLARNHGLSLFGRLH